MDLKKELTGIAVIGLFVGTCGASTMRGTCSAGRLMRMQDRLASAHTRRHPAIRKLQAEEIHLLGEPRSAIIDCGRGACDGKDRQMVHIHVHVRPWEKQLDRLIDSGFRR